MDEDPRPRWRGGPQRLRRAGGGPHRRPAPSGARGAIDHFALAVDGHAILEAASQRLVAAGAQEVGEVQRLGDELSVFFRDPDGMGCEVCCAADG